MDYRPDATDNVELFIFSSGARPATDWPVEIERRGHTRSQFSSHVLVRPFTLWSRATYFSTGELMVCFT